MALSVDELQQELDRLKGAAGGAATGVSQFGQALAGPAGGLGTFKNMLQGSTTALGSLAKLAPGGKEAAAVMEALSKTLGVSIDVIDRTNRVYQTLGNTGQVLGETQASLREQGDRFGLAIGLNEEAARLFAKTMTTNSKELARLGGTAVLGSRRLGEAFEAMGPVRVALQNIGISYEEQIEGLAAYTRMQTMGGLAQQMTTQQLAQGTADYLRKLQDLAAVTGVSRQDQIKAQESARAEQRFGAYLIQEQRREAELRRQGRTAEADAVAKSRRELEAFNATVANIDQEMAKGLRDIAAGAVNTAEAQKVVVSLGGDARATMEGLKRGTITSGEALKRLGVAADRSVERTNKLAQVSGTYNQRLLSQQGLQALADTARGDVDKRMTQAAKDRIAQEKNLQTDVAKTNLASNKARQQQIIAGRAIEGTADATLGAVNAMGDKVIEYLPSMVDKFNNFAKAITSATTESQTFAEFLKRTFNATLGLGEAAPTYPGGSRSAEDVGRNTERFREQMRREGILPPSGRAPAAEPQSDVLRLTVDQIQALQPTTLKIDPAQVRELKPTAEPTARAARLVADRLDDLALPNLATPGFGNASRQPVMDDERLRNQAANITRKYMDMVGDAGIDKFRQSVAQSTPKIENLGSEMPKIDLSRLIENTTNRPDIMRVKMPEVSLPSAPTRQETADQTRQVDQNFQQMVDQFNAQPRSDEMAPLLTVMNDMLNVQRQQSATMMKMLQAQRN